MLNRKPEFILVIFALIIILPVLYHHAPLYIGTPDILYVKAKILWVNEGMLFTDPITGYANFHPPFYHLFLSLFVRFGLDIDTLLLIVSITNVCLTFLFVYLLILRIFGERTAFWVMLLMPFITNFMGFGHQFLASSFHFSVPIYLAGLWLYLKPSAGIKNDILASAFWGLAFLISPVYFFIIGFTFAYDLIIKRNFRRIGLMAVIFLISIIPFFIQAIIVTRAGMSQTGTFSFWRGIPDFEWIKELSAYFLSPVKKKPLSWPVIPALALTIFGLIGMWRRRTIGAFPIIAALAYLFTAYHFSYQYAIRIHFFLSLFLVGYAINYLPTVPINRILRISVLCLIIGFGMVNHYHYTNRLYSLRAEFMPIYQSRYSGLRQNLSEHIEPGSFVLATPNTYRYFLMPFFRVHGLVAYRSAEYFQINRDVAREMLIDYNRIRKSEDISRINQLCEKYDISTCLIRTETEADMPAFQTIAKNWNLIYHDNYFDAYRH